MNKLQGWIRGIAVGLLFMAVQMPAAQAATITFLGIDGMLGPGDAGNYPVDADFSWISHRYPGSASAHIWTLAPGSDGGVIIGSAQSGQGQITAPRAMYNLNSWLFSVGDGIHYDANTEAFDFSNIRLNWGGDIYDFGFGAGYSALIPHVAGPGDVAAANGWWADAGNYHLVFRGAGQCAGCELAVYLTGQMIATPLPGAALLAMSGLGVLLPGAWRRKSSTTTTINR